MKIYRIITYILDHQVNYTRQAITKELLDAGHKKLDIDRAYDIINAESPTEDMLQSVGCTPAEVDDLLVRLSSKKTKMRTSTSTTSESLVWLIISTFLWTVIAGGVVVFRTILYHRGSIPEIILYVGVGLVLFLITINQSINITGTMRSSFVFFLIASLLFWLLLTGMCTVNGL